MKIEFLYKDDTYESLINGVIDSLSLEEKEVAYIPIVQVGLNMFSFSKSGDNETTAKKLDEIKEIVFRTLKPDNLFVITDEVSGYFCQRLYPQVTNFERGLRKVLYLASIKSRDENTINVCRQIEEKEFAEIYQVLFSDKTYITEAKKIVNSTTPTFSKHDMIKKLSEIVEVSLWDKLFKGKYSYIPENFLEIKKGRNKIMHSRNISFEDYSAIKHHLNKANKTLRQIEFDVLEKENFNFNHIISSLVEAIGAFSKALTNLTNEMFSSKFSKEIDEQFLESLDYINVEEDSLQLEEAETTDIPDEEAGTCTAN